MSDQGAKKRAFLFNGKEYATAAECVAAFTATKANARKGTPCCNLLSVKVVEKDGVEVVKVECSLCGGTYGASNIARLAKEHFKAAFTSCCGSSNHSSSSGKRADAPVEQESGASCKCWVGSMGGALVADG
jgi:hypothetical protein